MENLAVTKSGVTVRFLEADAACEYLVEDDHIRRLTALDLSLRLRSEISSEAEGRRRYVSLLRDQCRDWSPREKYTFLKIIEDVAAAAERFAPLALPDTLLLIKTTGRQEFGAFYTSRRAIVLPARETKSAVYLRVLPPARRNMFKVLSHEIFHVYSYLHPVERRELYGELGFFLPDSVELHPNLKGRLITNPDAHDLVPLIRVQSAPEGRPFTAALLTVSRYTEYTRGKSRVTEYAAARLFEMQESDGIWESVISEDGSLRGMGLSSVKDFYEQVGTITSYVYHPDEILAEGFSLLLQIRSGKVGAPTSHANRRILRILEQHLN